MSDLDQKQANAARTRLLERAALGETLSQDERLRLEASFSGDQTGFSSDQTGSSDDQTGEDAKELDEKLAALERSNARILARYPAEMVAARIQSELDARASRPNARGGRRNLTRPLDGWGARVAGVGALLAVGLAFLLVLNMQGSQPAEQDLGGQKIARGLDPTPRSNQIPPPTQAPPSHPGAAEGVRIKGAKPGLVVWRKNHNARAERLVDGASVSAGDKLQLEYQAIDAAFGVICSLDGRGEVSLHYPAYRGASTKLEKGRNTLDFAFELDDAPDFERFFLITANQPLDVEQITKAIEALGRGDDPERARPELPAEHAIKSLVLEKK